MGQVLHQGLLQGWVPVGTEKCIDNVLAQVGRFSGGDRREVKSNSK